MKDLSPNEWHNLLERMQSNPVLFQIMFRFEIIHLDRKKNLKLIKISVTKSK